ncbi:MAG: hypothetical protein IJ247_03615 [Bacilli bacterium]|nr:hypothetical protein [Bacilli bacterium]
MEHFFYSNVGRKIQWVTALLSMVVFAVLVAFGIIFIINGVVDSNNDILVQGIAYICVSPFFIVLSWIIYGFGVLIQDTHDLRRENKEQNQKIIDLMTIIAGVDKDKLKALDEKLGHIELTDEERLTVLRTALNMGEYSLMQEYIESRILVCEGDEVLEKIIEEASKGESEAKKIKILQAKTKEVKSRIGNPIKKIIK